MRHGRNALVLAFCILATLVLEAKPLTPYNQGYDQGRQAGRREGRERGGVDGRYDGEADGYQQGLIQGQQNLQSEAWQSGLSQGQTEGATAGRTKGQKAGLKLGTEEGQVEGQRRGRKSADQAALKAVSERARTEGRERAALADPKKDGVIQGKQAGIVRAQARADEIDFPRGREAYRQEQFQRPIQQESEVRQAQLSGALPLWYRRSAVHFGRRARPGCDYRYCRYPSDNEEFQRAYRKGYYAGYCSAYDSQYNWRYRTAFDSNFRWGLNQARGVNLEEHGKQAYQEGYQASFEKSFQTAQESARKQAYTSAFEAAFQAAYETHYPEFERTHYVQLEEQAFQELYGPVFQSVFDKHEQTSFQKHYPEEARVAYQTGRRVEKADFEKRPVRMLSAWLTPTDIVGLQLVSLKLRNFSDGTVAGHRIKVEFGDENSRLYHPLPANSVTIVTGIFRVRGESQIPSEVSAALTQDGLTVSLGRIAIKTDS